MRFLCSLLILLCSQQLFAADQAITSLDLLLEKAKQHQSAEKALLHQREQAFLQENKQQKQLLEEAQQRFLTLQKINNPLQQQSDANTQEIQRLRLQLNEQVEDLGDIYSVYSEFSGDFIARLTDSIISSQLPLRAQTLHDLASNTALATVDDMRALLFLVQEEMTEASKIQPYFAEVTQTDGSKQKESIYRIGTFSLIGEHHLLLYTPKNHELLAQQNQPRAFAKIAANFQQRSNNDWQQIIIDPSHGSLLGLLDKSPKLKERIQQGAEVGYTIIALGIAGLLLAFYRLLYLSWVWLKVRKQRQHINTPAADNPLGRVLKQAMLLQHTDEETLQIRLNAAVLKELPALERGQSLIKLLAAIAPLMGLLGTVVGMIATFQSISLFGSGDPQLMAGGISQALVTTVQGLLVAIPLLFIHNIISSFSRSLIQVLDEQSAGILASHIETQKGESHV